MATTRTHTKSSSMPLMGLALGVTGAVWAMMAYWALEFIIVLWRWAMGGPA